MEDSRTDIGSYFALIWRPRDRSGALTVPAAWSVLCP